MRCIILLFAGVLIVNISLSQESAKYLKLKNKILVYKEGYILDKSGEKIDGLIKDTDAEESKRSRRIIFLSKTGKKKTYHPSEIDEFEIRYRKYVSSGKLFYEVIKAGKKISLLKLSYTGLSGSFSPGTTAPILHETEEFYLKKANQDIYKLIRKRKFKEEFSDYFSDCEQLKSKILNDQLNFKDIDHIVFLYNFECK